LKIKTIEDYIEMIYSLQKEKKRVHTNDIASAFDINPASVTEIFQKLSEEGYIDYEKYNGAILTKKGEKLAIRTLDRHNQLKEFLIILGVDDKTAEMDACEMEHILHKSTMDAIIKFIGDRK
jgi:Mn-dependent DtxR family transcriptional regulator